MRATPPDEEEAEVAVLDFSQQRELAGKDGWLQGRYYGEEGSTVRELLSFDSIFEVCPFEVGVNRRADRKAFRERCVRIEKLLDLRELRNRVFNTLSNGEMRRVLFARALLKGARRLVLNDPMAGLDPARRADFRRIIASLKAEGVEVTVNCRHPDELLETAAQCGVAASPAPAPAGGTWTGDGAGEPVVELSKVFIRFGRRVLFKDFSWTIRRGEHWVLCGPNGSGKTLLTALICGDSPLAYANDVRVFGIPRAPGHELSKIRRRIAMVSPEMQTYLDQGPFELLEAALAKSPELLILDEPCLNLERAMIRRLLGRVEDYLRDRPETTTIVIAHRQDHVPKGFKLRVDLLKARAAD